MPNPSSQEGKIAERQNVEGFEKFLAQTQNLTLISALGRILFLQGLANAVAASSGLAFLLRVQSVMYVVL
jgi:hypothetical protein